MSDSVKGVGDHPVDLADGRNIGPGEIVTNVDTADAHNAGLINDGMIAVVGGAEEPAHEAAQTDKAPKATGHRGTHSEGAKS